MTVALISPNLVAQENDLFTTGIVYMPVSLAYTAAALRKAGHAVEVIDAFGESPRQVRTAENFFLYGLNERQIAERVPPNITLVFVYALNLISHISTVNIVRAVKQARPRLKIIVLENTQAVTAYALKFAASEFYEAGADFILTGEGEDRAVQLTEAIATANPASPRTIDGIGAKDFYNPPLKPVGDLDLLPFPAWDLFPLRNYWNLRFAHGPVTSKMYLPILTSRGCPYHCRFCVVPETNNQKWRARSPQNVVDEMQFWGEKYGVAEFHIEDLDPTISEERTRGICHEIIKRGLKIVWKIAAGTKVETIKSGETIDLMAQAGCRYISISPETGSPRVLKLMQKPFDLAHAVTLVRRMNAVGIRSQACFVLGFPGETDEDLDMTCSLVRDLTREGVDEVALFIATPVPGSAIYKEFSGYESLSELNFTPAWRTDYQRLNRFRLRLYASFLMWKLLSHPVKLLRQPWNFLRRRFETKMEMVPYRALKLWMWARIKLKKCPQKSPLPFPVITKRPRLPR